MPSCCLLLAGSAGSKDMIRTSIRQLFLSFEAYGNAPLPWPQFLPGSYRGQGLHPGRSLDSDPTVTVYKILIYIRALVACLGRYFYPVHRLQCQPRLPFWETSRAETQPYTFALRKASRPVAAKEHVSRSSESSSCPRDVSIFDTS